MALLPAFPGGRENSTMIAAKAGQSLARLLSLR
jgi:hypothetical protein